jgi:restriction system protein
MTAEDVPPYHDLLLPALQAVGELGGSASISEIVEPSSSARASATPSRQCFTTTGRRLRSGYRLAWARTYLEGMGLLTNSSRGVWALTDDGTGQFKI